MNEVPISIVVSLVTAAATVGIALGKLGAHAERIKSLERTRERTGARLEALEKRVAVDRARQQTAAKGIVIPSGISDDGEEEGSGEHG